MKACMKNSTSVFSLCCPYKPQCTLMCTTRAEWKLKIMHYRVLVAMRFSGFGLVIELCSSFRPMIKFTMSIYILPK